MKRLALLAALMVAGCGSPEAPPTPVTLWRVVTVSGDTIHVPAVSVNSDNQVLALYGRDGVTVFRAPRAEVRYIVSLAPTEKP